MNQSHVNENGESAPKGLGSLPIKEGAPLESQREPLQKKLGTYQPKLKVVRRVGNSVETVKQSQRLQKSASPKPMLNPSLRSKSITPVQTSQVVKSVKAQLVAEKKEVKKDIAPKIQNTEQKSVQLKVP